MTDTDQTPGDRAAARDRAPREPQQSTIADGWYQHPAGCPRGRNDCSPLGRRASEGNVSFMCCGENDGTHGGPSRDRWRFCVKSEHGVDVLVNVDRRDMVDLAAVLLEGLSSEAARVAAGEDFFLPAYEEEDGE